MQAKNKIEEGARALQRKMQQASALIDGLAGEFGGLKTQKSFCLGKQRLVGDCVCGAFTSYAGGFNQDFRDILINKTYIASKTKIPVTVGLDVCTFMVDEGTKGDWSMQKLPNDPLSIQNGVLVTNATR